MIGRHKEKILVLVKTYPTKSNKYVETVCTAGIREDGSWVRIFPIPFRRLEDYQRFKKYQWIECTLYKSEKDKRPESYHIDTNEGIIPGEILNTKNGWEARKQAILYKSRIFKRIAELFEAVEKNTASLAIFKPKDVKMTCEKNYGFKENDDNFEKFQLAQLDLFDKNDWRINFKGVEKVPYNFIYEVTDEEGKSFKHKIIDWEINALYLRQKKKYGEEKAVKDVMEKYTEFLNKEKYDLYLYLGTIHQFQQRNFQDPWIIIGVAPFKKNIN